MKHFKIYELNRKINISIWTACIILCLIVSVVFLFLYLKRNTVYYVHYDEKSDLNYNVVLKDNEYFEDESLHENNQYIASLIDYINANFKYDLTVKEDLKYKYNYKITANVNVIDNNTNRAIYTFSEDLLNEVTGESDGVLNIDENVKINYNKYNKRISEFVNVYNLSNVTSKLTLKMYVGIDGDVEELNKSDDSVISLDIPLTTNTVAIDANYDLSNNVDNLITLKTSYQNSKMWLKLSIAIFAIDLVALGLLIKYIIDTQTDEDKYNGQLKKILNNYGSHISKVEDEFNMEGYQILKVANFVDLLEIRDTIQSPIIMIENKEQFVTCFIIPTNNNLLYFYSLGVTQYALPSGQDSGNIENEEEKVREQDAQKYKIKNSKLVLNFLLISCIILSTCLLSVGYAAITETSIDIGVNIFSGKYEQIFISEVKFASSTGGADVANSKIIDHTDTMLHSDICLSTEDANSSITYTITIFNNSDADKQFKKISYQEELYINSAIGYRLDGLAEGDHIDRGTGKTFNITFFYQDTTDLTKNQLESFLNFDFGYYYGEENDIDVFIKDEGSYEFAGAKPDNPVNFADITNINFQVVNGTEKKIIGLKIDIVYRNSTGAKQTARIDLCDANDNIIAYYDDVQFGGSKNEALTLTRTFNNIPSTSSEDVQIFKVKFSKVKSTNDQVNVEGIILTPIYQ